MRVLSLVFLVSSALALASGCKPELIPGTTVEDSEENRKVLEFLTRYQAAMQARNADEVVKLCAADYFETNGNVDPLDDYNLDGLKAKLTAHFQKTQELTLEVYVQQVERADDKTVAVAFRYNARALVAFPAASKWLTVTEVNKIKLRPIDDDEMGFRILSGL